MIKSVEWWGLLQGDTVVLCRCCHVQVSSFLLCVLCFDLLRRRWFVIWNEIGIQWHLIYWHSKAYTSGSVGGGGGIKFLRTIPQQALVIFATKSVLSIFKDRHGGSNVVPVCNCTYVSPLFALCKQRFSNTTLIPLLYRAFAAFYCTYLWIIIICN